MQDLVTPLRRVGGTDEQDDTTGGLLSASEAPSLSPQLLKVDNTLGQSHQEGWGKCKTLLETRNAKERVLSISRGRFPRGAGHLFTGPERSKWGLTHHDEFGLCVSRRVRVTGLGEICGAAVPHHSYRQEAGPARSARPLWGGVV